MVGGIWLVLTVAFEVLFGRLATAVVVQSNDCSKVASEKITNDTRPLFNTACA